MANGMNIATAAVLLMNPDIIATVIKNTRTVSHFCPAINILFQLKLQENQS